MQTSLGSPNHRLGRRSYVRRRTPPGLGEAGGYSPVSSSPASQRATNSALIEGSAFPARPHSQIVTTRQPAKINVSTALRSRASFARNFSFQKSALDLGVVVFQHPCRCQKQPCTKTQARRFLNTMSGLPGSSLAWRRYRSPRACRPCRSAISGPVFFCRTLRMMAERLLGSTLSIPGQALRHVATLCRVCAPYLGRTRVAGSRRRYRRSGAPRLPHPCERSLGRRQSRQRRPLARTDAP